MATILILQGPNLNLLGIREPEIYGNETLSSLHLSLVTLGAELGHLIETDQNNSESLLIDRLHLARETNIDFIIFNPAAFTHTSIALRDALLAIQIPFVEVHLSNVFKREAFRQSSYFSDIAVGTLSGLGTTGYLLALRYAHHYLTIHSS